MGGESLNIVFMEYVSRNLGDTVTAECARFLLEEASNRKNICGYMIHEYNMYQHNLAFIRKADLIVVTGGGLIKFKRENFRQYVPEVIDMTQEQDIPIFLNAIGVEGFDGSDERCLKLKGALNQPCVKGITVRDDLDLLVRHYLDDEKEWLEQALDPTAFCAHVYGYEGGSGSSVIGFGIARDDLYPDYGLISATKQFWLDL